MKLYTLKVNVKGSKPPQWRRIQISSNLTFAQLAAVLETALECFDEDKVYQFEFYQYCRIFELDYRDEIEIEDKYGYTYMDSTDIYINDFFDSEKKFTFRIFQEPCDYEEYKAEIEDTAEIKPGQKNREELYTPVIIKESSAKFAGWSDFQKVNEKISRDLKTRIAKKENLSLYEIAENIRNLKGLTITKRPVSRHDSTFNNKINNRIEEIMNNPDILINAYKAVSWMEVCVETANMLYMVTPLDTLYSLFCRNSEIKADFSKFMVYLYDYLKVRGHNYIHENLLVPDQLADVAMIKRAMNIQRDIEYYIPEYQEILDLGSMGYPAHDDAYIEFKEFLRSEMCLDDDVIKNICRETQAIFAAEEFGGQEFINMTAENGVVINSKNQADKFSRIMMRLVSRTCKIEFRGHRPADMGKFSDGSQHRTIVMKNLSLPINFKPDETFQGGSILNSEAIRSGRISGLKISPNEPCPCGSGKKYKKCCALGR